MQKLLLVALTMAATSHATLFDNLKASFDKSSLPVTKDLNGHWSGRCVESTAPDMLQPAVFIFKVVEDQTEFPPTRPSLTYFWKANVKKDLFDTYTPAQVEKDIDVKAWLAKEQWQKAEVNQGSIENKYFPAADVTYLRSVRMYNDEFNSTIVLRVTRSSGVSSEVRTMCYFQKKLTGAQEPVPAQYLIGDSGLVQNQYVELHNPKPEANLVSMNVINMGTKSVTVDDLRFYYQGQMIGQTTKAVKVLGGQTLVVKGPNTFGPTFKMDRADFYVDGSTQNLRIIGVTKPAPFPLSTHEVVEME